jgi:hypothetical protein
MTCAFLKTYIFVNIVKEIFSPLNIQSTIFTIGSMYEYVYIKHADSHTVYLYVRYDSEDKHPLLSQTTLPFGLRKVK